MSEHEGLGERPHVRPVDAPGERRHGARDRRRPRLNRTTLDGLASDVEDVVQEMWAEQDNLRDGWRALAVELRALTDSFNTFSAELLTRVRVGDGSRRLLWALVGAVAAIIVAALFAAWLDGYTAQRSLTMAEARRLAIAEVVPEIPQGIEYRLPPGSARAGYPRVHVLQRHPALAQDVPGITALERDRACEAAPVACRWEP